MYFPPAFAAILNFWSATLELNQALRVYKTQKSDRDLVAVRLPPEGPSRSLRHSCSVCSCQSFNPATLVAFWPRGPETGLPSASSFLLLRSYFFEQQKPPASGQGFDFSTENHRPWRQQVFPLFSLRLAMNPYAAQYIYPSPSMRSRGCGNLMSGDKCLRDIIV